MSRRAFELRDRVSERERFFISWRYYIDAAQAWDKALELAPSWTTTYPREAFAFNSLGLASAAFGEHEQAVAAFREAIRLDPRFVPPHGNLVGSLIALEPVRRGQGAACDEAAERGIDVHQPPADGVPAGVRRRRRGGDGARARPRARHAGRDVGARSGRRGPRRSPADCTRAHELFQRGVAGRASATTCASSPRSGRWRTPRRTRSRGSAPRRGAEVAGGARAQPRQLHARAGEPRRSRCAATPTAAARLPDELRAAISGRDADDADSAAGHRRRRWRCGAATPARALELLEPVKPYDHAPSAEFWPAYLRGQAYLQLRDGRGGRRRSSAQSSSIAARRRPRRCIRWRSSASRARPALTGDRRRRAGAYEALLRRSGAAPIRTSSRSTRRARIRTPPVVHS